MNAKYLICQIFKKAIWGIMFLVILYTLIDATVETKAEKDIANSSNVDRDTLQLINNIADRIDRELTSPSSNERRVGYYGTVSQAVIRNLIFQLAALGPAYADDIYNKAKTKESKTDRALLISLGLLKDIRVHDDLREIVLTENDPYLRGVAVRALSTYKDTLDVPAITEALYDSNTVLMELDYSLPNGQMHQLINIVGMEAIPALYGLGYEVKPDTMNKGKYIVRKRE
jgi:hypothetical protein